MAHDLYHRGPDAHRRKRTEAGAIGVTRLRIIDLHERADQPFESRDGSVALACNGEIYNANVLRNMCTGFEFRSRSDVEPLLPLCLSRGAVALSLVDGMFAMALWDSSHRTVTLARDRAGEKPLFYMMVGSELWFASEFGTLARHNPVGNDLDTRSAYWFLKLGYVPDPRTMVRGIRQIEPGTAVTFSESSTCTTRFWNPERIRYMSIDRETARGKLRELVESAVATQMHADVPTGIFASGGLDSTILTALAARKQPGILTFTARFARAGYDESLYAEYAARKLGARNIAVLIDSSSLRHALDRSIESLWLPLGDPALLPTIILAERARDDVGVVLSGEGADELFGGYPTYPAHAFADHARPFLQAALPLVAPANRAIEPGPGRVPFTYMAKRFLDGALLDWPERHFCWFGTGLPDHLFKGPGLTWSDCDFVPTRYHDPGTAMLTDYLTYLRCGLLPKIDRATMRNSLEARAPFLDRHVTRFALALPPTAKLHGLRGKILLREAFCDIVPGRILRRTKQGLSVPLADWMRNELRDELIDTINEHSLTTTGLVEPAATVQVVQRFLAGDSYLTRGVWTLFILQRWLTQWIPGVSR